MSTNSALQADATVSKASPWQGILIIVAVCGAIPALWNLTQLEGLHRSAYLVGYFALNLILPFASGFLVTVLWRRPRPVGVLLLAVCASAAEALIEGLVITHVTIQQQQLVLATEDYIAWGSVVCLFAAGGFYRLLRAGDKSESKATESGNIGPRDWLLLATKVLSIAGTALSLYAASKHQPLS